MLFFASRHDGIALEAVGRVVLTAAHAERADPDAESYPAIVNHVVFFGDGISPRTVLRGFTITGANNFASRSEGPEPIQPDSSNGVRWEKGLFFYADGGGIKVFGRSYPTLEGLELHDNYASPCGGGISIEHRGFDAEAVLIKNSIFRNNSCQITGAAVDVLPGSAAVLDNCLFVGNVANTRPRLRGPPWRRRVQQGARLWCADGPFPARASKCATAPSRTTGTALTTRVAAVRTATPSSG